MLGQSRVAWLIPLAACVVARKRLCRHEDPPQTARRNLTCGMTRSGLQVVEPRRFEGVSVSNGAHPYPSSLLGAGASMGL